MLETLAEYGLQVAATLVITLIGVFGAWQTMKLGKSAQLENINAAQKEVIRAAKMTVGELQQTLVENLKASHADGKLTQDEIAALGGKLVDMTIQKLSMPTFELLSAAAVDIEAMITGAGESWIGKLKSGA